MGDARGALHAAAPRSSDGAAAPAAVAVTSAVTSVTSSASSAQSFVPFLALVERKAEPRDGVLRLHAGAVGVGVDVCAAMPLDGVCALAAGPTTGAFAAVGTNTGDVLAFDVVTGVTIARLGDLRGEDGGVVGVATAPWEAAAGGAFARERKGCRRRCSSPPPRRAWRRTWSARRESAARCFVSVMSYYNDEWIHEILVKLQSVSTDVELD